MSEGRQAMEDGNLTDRVGILERKMERLEELPEALASLASQVSHFRDEMRVELSALRADVRAGDDETRRYMRILYEDALDRISRVGEGRPPQN
jgi:hypothetical protein